MPSITQMPSGRELLPSMRAEENDPFTFNGTRVSERGGKVIFLELIMGMEFCVGEEPILIFFVLAQMETLALLIKSIPIMQGNCKLSINCTVVLKEWFAKLMEMEYVPLEFKIWPLAAHNLIGFPLTGGSLLSKILCLRFEFIKVKEDPVSKRADNLNLLAVTVAIGRSGIVMEKQLDNTAQKLMTAAGKRFELLPFFLRSFP